jgi:peptidoglycan/LPS O-acetylase OafA/YrhL
MDKRFLRPLLIVEFLLAIQVVFTFWSQVGGQYHLDLMFWPWKLGVCVLAAGLIVAVTGNLVRNDGTVSRRAVVYIAVLIATLVVAGVVTYYYHINEPTDQDDDDDEPVRISRIVAPPLDRRTAELAES